MDKFAVVVFFGLMFSLFTGTSARASDLGMLPLMTDTTTTTPKEREKPTQPEKTQERKPQKVVNTSDIVNDVQQTVKKVPKARRQVKPVTVPAVKAPVRVKTPKVKTTLPVKIKL